MNPTDPTPPDRLLSRLLGPSAFELTCDRCVDELDRYVDLQLDGADAGLQVPGMRAHLQGCPACAEDHESLATFAAQRRAAP